MIGVDSKPCTKCREVKPLTEYFVQRSRRDGRLSECKACHKIRKVAYYEVTRESRREKNRLYRVKKYGQHGRKRNPRLPGETRAQADNRRQSGVRIEALKRYGSHCACCGETQLEFLAIDHINNDGARERKEVGSGNRFYYWLRKNGYPQRGYQVLCHNCNLAKQFYKGCPHQKIVLKLVQAA